MARCGMAARGRLILGNFGEEIVTDFSRSTRLPYVGELILPPLPGEREGLIGPTMPGTGQPIPEFQPTGMSSSFIEAVGNIPIPPDDLLIGEIQPAVGFKPLREEPGLVPDGSELLECEFYIDPRVYAAIYQPNTIYVSAAGVGTGESLASPTGLQQIRRLLSNPNHDLAGIQILFRQGDTWDVASADSASAEQFLMIRASGSASYPLLIGSYRDAASPPAKLRPVFDGRNIGAVGISIEGARYVQIKDLEVTGFFTAGVQICADVESPAMIGARDINLISMKIHKNPHAGIFIHSNLGGHEYGLRRDGTVGNYYVQPYALTESGGVGDDVPVRAEQWWTSSVCVENCEIVENGDGLDDGDLRPATGEANVLITSYAARCKIRHCLIRGLSRPSSEVRGTDGITFEGAGPGHIVEYNEISHMSTIVGSNDDGEGVNIKGTYNRTYVDPTTGQPYYPVSGSLSTQGKRIRYRLAT
jgi:hypothetical protein